VEEALGQRGRFLYRGALNRFDGGDTNKGTTTTEFFIGEGLRGYINVCLTVIAQFSRCRYYSLFILIQGIYKISTACQY
jgi:hypothetical protein